MYSGRFFFFLKKSVFISLGSFSRENCNGDSVSPLLSRVLPSEVEVLESIYLDELQVMKGNGRYVLSNGRAGVSVVREFCTESGLRVL